MVGWDNERMQQVAQTPPLVGVTDDGQPYASRWFREIREDALDAWEAQRVDADGEAWECRWQVASQRLPHTHCSTPGCAETHVSLYCSFNDLAEQLVDLLTDERLDDVVVMGTAPDLSILPWPDSLDEDTAAAFRFYVRVLWAAGVLLDDLEGILKRAGFKKNLRATLSAGAPLDVDKLHAFINHVAKHGAKWSASLHCWNQHAAFYFEDSDLAPIALAGLDPISTSKIPTTPDAVVMPRLKAIVDTLCAALRNVDAVMGEPQLKQLAIDHGACG